MTNEEAVKISEERLAFGEKEYSGVAKDYIAAIKTAISALRAQEKEPNIGRKYALTTGLCPMCGKRLEVEP